MRASGILTLAVQLNLNSCMISMLACNVRSNEHLLPGNQYFESELRGYMHVQVTLVQATLQLLESGYMCR